MKPLTLRSLGTWQRHAATHARGRNHELNLSDSKSVTFMGTHEKNGVH